MAEKKDSVPPRLPRQLYIDAREVAASPVIAKVPADVRRVLTEAENASKKLGRPSLGEPWIALGMKRRTYFARKKAGLLPG